MKDITIREYHKIREALGETRAKEIEKAIDNFLHEETVCCKNITVREYMKLCSRMNSDRVYEIADIIEEVNDL